MYKLTNDRRKWGRWALLAGMSLSMFALLARPYLWIRLPGAVVTFDGKTASLAAVYRSRHGQLLLWNRASRGGDPFIIYPSRGLVLEGNGGSILDGGNYLANALFALNRNGPPLGVSLTSPKLDIDPHLIFRPGCVEFTEEVTTAGSSHWTTRRVRITF